MAEQETATAVASNKESNADRRRGKLERQRRKNHVWLVSTTARALIKIKQNEQEIRDLGFEPEPLFEPDFNDESMLAEYAQMTYNEE